MFSLVPASLAVLPSHQAALLAGWSPDNVTPEPTRLKILEKIEHNAQAYVAALYDWEAKGDAVVLPDGSEVARLPGFVRWVVAHDPAQPAEQGEFCGSINFRRMLGCAALPPWCLGHLGYSVVPRWRGQGVAKFALAQLLAQARAAGQLDGMDYVVITTDVDNIASQRVIEHCGGQVVEQFTHAHANYAGPLYRYRIAL